MVAGTSDRQKHAKFKYMDTYGDKVTEHSLSSAPHKDLVTRKTTQKKLVFETEHAH